MLRKLQDLKKKESGFTIVEVMIVLAIAGLIMLIVFLAIPALQRNSRNTARNSDAARVATAVRTCLANRNNQAGQCVSDANIERGEMSQLTDATSFGAVGLGNFTPAYSTTGAHVIFGLQCTPDGSGTQNATTGGIPFTVTYGNETGINRCIDG